MKKLLGLILLVACCGLQAGVITLQSSDGKQFKIDQEKAEKSITLKHLLEDLKEEELSTTPIPFPNINGSTLEVIVKCLEKPEDTEGIIASLSGPKLYAFNLAVGYLDIPEIYEKLPAIRWLKDLLRQIVAGPVLKGHTGGVTSVAISPDGKFIVTGSSDGTARTWNIDGTKRAVLKGHEDIVNSVAISPDSKFIVTGSWDETVRIWNIDGKERAVLGAAVSAVAISPDGKFIVTGSQDGTVRILNADGTELTVLRGHTGDVSAVAISRDGKFIVTGSQDGTVRIWNIDGTEKAELKGHEVPVTSVAISPDGKFIVTGSDDKTAHIWNIDGTEKAELKGHKGAVFAVAISPDSKFIVTGSQDGTVRIWNVDGTERAELKGHKRTVAVAISPDGKFIVTGSYDKTARIWYIGNPEHVSQLNIDQINLITKIYELVQNKQKLDLVQRSADTLKIRAQKKVEENLFRSLPQDIQTVLRDDVIVPQR